MDTALPQKIPFILDRNLAKANCTEDRVCTSCDTVVLGLRLFNVKATFLIAKNCCSLGYAFHIASTLSGDMSSIYERIEDAVVQADEIDGRMLQFEGGLSITGNMQKILKKNSEKKKF